MGIYLNPGNDNFRRNIRTETYIDKSLMISKVNKLIDTDFNYICMSRPRRFGKSMAANMLCAYYSKGCDSKELFKGLNIESDSTFKEHLNRHNVIYINFAEIDGLVDDENDIVKEVTRLVLEELQEAYPDIVPSVKNKIPGFLQAIHKKMPDEKFIIIIDEYDLIFREYKSNKKLQESYINFLKGLFKNDVLKSMFEIAYLTGILPIIRENSQSKLNEFLTQITMLDPFDFASYIGFTEDEVKDLCNKYDMDIAEMKRWYDGYSFDYEKSVYAPQSVVQAITKRKYLNYWNTSSAALQLVPYLEMNKEELKQDVETMIAGGEVEVTPSNFNNTPVAIKDKNDILTYFIHLGYLAYEERKDKGYARIPNYEVRKEWIENIKSANKYKYMIDFINNSEELFYKTKELDEAYVANAVKALHLKYTSVIKRQFEESLAMVVLYAYMYLENDYEKTREEPHGKGYADIVYKPYIKSIDNPTLLIELKYNDTAENAIKQIKNKEYFTGLEEYQDNMFIIGIAYDDKGNYGCKIEKYKK